MDAIGKGERLILVAGTGRSGTHVLGRLIGAHPGYADVPVEARFHCNVLGLSDLLAEETTLAEHVAKLRGFWWHRVRSDGRPRGLYNILGHPEFAAAVVRFEREYPERAEDACRELVDGLLWSWARRRGKPGLVEMSSHNLRAAAPLSRLYPGVRFVHALRDGRDVASSVTQKSWGPRTIGRAIGWWGDRLRALDSGVRAMGDRGAVHAVVLDRLVREEREAEFARLAGFVDPGGDHGDMREFFEARMSEEEAHSGRWQDGRGALARAWVRRRYERELSRLESEGNHAAAALIAAYERAR